MRNLIKPNCLKYNNLWVKKTSKKTQSRRFGPSHLEIGVQASRVPHLGEKPQGPQVIIPFETDDFLEGRNMVDQLKSWENSGDPTKCAGLDGLFWMNWVYGRHKKMLYICIYSVYVIYIYINIPLIFHHHPKIKSSYCRLVTILLAVHCLWGRWPVGDTTVHHRDSHFQPAHPGETIDESQFQNKA